jgi:hypothetical protein
MRDLRQSNRSGGFFFVWLTDELHRWLRHQHPVCGQRRPVIRCLLEGRFGVHGWLRSSESRVGVLERAVDWVSILSKCIDIQFDHKESVKKKIRSKIVWVIRSRKSLLDEVNKKKKKGWNLVYLVKIPSDSSDITRNRPQIFPGFSITDVARTNDLPNFTRHE